MDLYNNRHPEIKHKIEQITIPVNMFFFEQKNSKRFRDRLFLPSVIPSNY